MAERAKHERIHGPYPHKRRWRCIFVGADGRRTAIPFETREQAQAWKEAEQRKLGHETVGSRVNEFLEYKRARGLRASTLTSARYALVPTLRLAETDPPLSALTPEFARQLYARRCAEVKPATHRMNLARVSEFAQWCVKRGYLSDNPFAGIEPVGKPSRGKPQLRVDEARAWLAVALATPGQHALCASLALLTGARAGEIVDRLVRDLDDGGRLLWITEAKTRAGVRQLQVPEVLRERVLAEARNREPGELLFDEVTRFTLRYAVHDICRRAGVPIVTTHGLRGTFATIAVVAGTAAARVAAELGQTSAAVTERSYMAPGTAQLADAGRLQARLLQGEPVNDSQVPRSPDPDPSALN